jgi:hypothetical protein
MSAVAYFTDVEGQWDKLASFARDNPWVSLEGDRLVLAEGATFVFGGDAIDRGPAGRRIVAAFLEAKRRYGDRVVLLAGNRDINKMRLARELTGSPPARAPADVVAAGRAALLRWIFDNTMGAKKAFEMRHAELAEGGARVTGDDVVESFLADVAPDGALSRYLAACQLAYRHERTLFVHGAVTEESLGSVPGASRRTGDPDEWVAALNDFYRTQVAAFLDRRLTASGEPPWGPLVAYQAPLPGTRLNETSVVYGRCADALGNPLLPSRAVIEALQRAGIGRVVVGHTPSGDSPSLLAEDGFQLVIADNSYGRVERGSQVFVDGDQLQAAGSVVLDDGTERAVRVTSAGLDARGPVGLRDAATGRLVKGRLGEHEYLSFRFLGGYAVEQTALSEEACAALALVPPHGSAG